MADDKNQTASKGKPEPMKHRVLYMRHGDTADFHPLASCELGDKNADEDFASMRLEHITKARHAGAVRPEFKVTTEQKGEEI